MTILKNQAAIFRRAPLENAFLVRLDNSPNFYTKTEDGKIFGTPFPASGLRMNYDAAIGLCQRFQSEGFQQAVVTDRFGALPTSEDLESVKRSLTFIVTFSSHFFVGVDKNGRELGSRDRKLAKEMSKLAAVEISKKLKRKGHLDAAIAESAGSQSIDPEAEVEAIWPAHSAK